MRKTYRHRLMCGDSSNVQHIDALMDGQAADMVYTDPPYGIKLMTNYAAWDAKEDPSKKLPGGRRHAHRPIHGDDEDYDPSFVLGYFDDCLEVFLWGGDYFSQSLPKNGSWLIWDKRCTKDGSVMDDWHGAHFETCWSKAKHQKVILRHLWSGVRQDTKESYVHPSQKPVALHEMVFAKWGSAGDLVVDLYGGSGSTLLACEKQGRRCFMSEIDPGYCDTILSRYEKLTGAAGVLLSPPEDVP